MKKAFKGHMSDEERELDEQLWFFPLHVFLLSSYSHHHDGPQRIASSIFILSRRSQNIFSWLSFAQLGRQTFKKKKKIAYHSIYRNKTAQWKVKVYKVFGSPFCLRLFSCYVASHCFSLCCFSGIFVISPWSHSNFNIFLLYQSGVQNEVTFLLTFKINVEPQVQPSLPTVIKCLFPPQHTSLS